MTKIYAHRGASAYAPENTLEAFDLAAQMGADGVELDVHLTKDGEVVVAHDDEVDRVSNGTGLIRNMTLAELKKLRFNRTHPEYENATIPTLREVLDLLKPTGLHINVEIKSDHLLLSKMEEKCVKLAYEAGMTDRVMYSSFDRFSLVRIKRTDPNIYVGLLKMHMPKALKPVDPWDIVQKLGFNAIHPHLSELLVPGIMEKARAMGMDMNVWTVNEDLDIRRVLMKGVNMLIGDRPDRAIEIRRRLGL